LTAATLPLTELYAPIREDLWAAERIFDEELVSDQPFIGELCDAVRSYRGKMLRPALLLLCGKACGVLTGTHHVLAAVVELVHAATLVHDDVLDGADERRRHPTVNSLSGNVAAVLLGDFLISHAFHLCSSVPGRHASRRIGSTTNRVCEGELLQNHHRGRMDVSESLYLEIVRRKTAALTAVSCELGAHFSGVDPSVAACLHRFGECAGIAFQIIDDVLDLTGDRVLVGKTLGSDTLQGKLTLPMIHCLASAPPQTADALREALTSPEIIRQPQIREWLQESDSIEYAVTVAEDHVSTARKQLEALPPSESRDSLDAMAEFIVNRRF